MKILMAWIALAFLFAGTANAQSCGSFPYTLTNGTTADASQVMANFEHARACANSNHATASFLRGWLNGFTMSTNVATPNTLIQTTAGTANSGDASLFMVLSAFSKNTNASWSAGAGNGCLDTGGSAQVNQWYHLYVIARTDTGVVDLLCSTSATSPTPPANYNKSRRIGSYKTDGSGQILPFFQDGDYFRWHRAVLDVDMTDVGTDSVLHIVSVPTGVRVQALINVVLVHTAQHYGIYVSDPAVVGQAPSQSVAPLMQVITQAANVTVATSLQIRTDTSGRLRTRANATGPSTVLRIATLGWIDSRGRFE